MDYDNGSDATGNGSWQNPYKTLAKGLDRVAHGGTIHMMVDESMDGAIRIGDDGKQVMIVAEGGPVRID